MSITHEKGFSLVELLAVIGIFTIIAAISVISWNSFAPDIILNDAANGLAEATELARTKALSEHNQWFILLNYTSIFYQSYKGGPFHFPANSYVIVDDDGWMGSGTRQYNLKTQFGGSAAEFAREYKPGTGNPATDWRHNNLMEEPELYQGPIRLGRGIVFMSPPNSVRQVRRIVFNYEEPFMFWQSSLSPSNTPIAPSNRLTIPAKIYIHNSLYKDNDTSKDNLAHRRIIIVYEKSTKISR